MTSNNHPALKHLCALDDIEEGKSKGFEIEGTAIFIVKKEGQLYAYKNHCPHLGVELEWMPDRFLDAENQHIQCSMHGALFTIHSGECLHGPCLGQQLQKIEICLIDDQIYAHYQDITQQ